MPGTRGYGQFCPVAKGAEVFAERWTPLIVRELLNGSHRFGELQQGLPGISQSLLTQRLRSLQRDGVVERRCSRHGRGWEYHLTPAGQDLGRVVEQLGAWGYRWATDRLSPADLNPHALMWFMRRRVNVAGLPERRVVVSFTFRDGPRQSFWLVLQRPEVDLCLKAPGFDVDLYVTADTMALTQVYLGHLELRRAMADGLIEVEGPRDLLRALPSWLGVSPFARLHQPPIAAAG